MRILILIDTCTFINTLICSGAWIEQVPWRSSNWKLLHIHHINYITLHRNNRNLLSWNHKKWSILFSLESNYYKRQKKSIAQRDYLYSIICFCHEVFWSRCVGRVSCTSRADAARVCVYVLIQKPNLWAMQTCDQEINSFLGRFYYFCLWMPHVNSQNKRLQ